MTVSKSTQESVVFVDWLAIYSARLDELARTNSDEPLHDVVRDADGHDSLMMTPRHGPTHHGSVSNISFIEINNGLLRTVFARISLCLWFPSTLVSPARMTCRLSRSWEDGHFRSFASGAIIW